MEVKIIKPVKCLLQRNYISEGDIVKVIYKDKIVNGKERYRVISRSGGVTYVDCDMCEIIEDGGIKMYKVVAENLGFGEAFEFMKGGVSVLGMRLPQWSEDVVIKIHFPDLNSKMTAPYLYVESRFGCVPWKETMIELFSEEWQVVRV